MSSQGEQSALAAILGSLTMVVLWAGRKAGPWLWRFFVDLVRRGAAAPQLPQQDPPPPEDLRRLEQLAADVDALRREVDRADLRDVLKRLRALEGLISSLESETRTSGKHSRDVSSRLHAKVDALESEVSQLRGIVDAVL